MFEQVNALYPSIGAFGIAQTSVAEVGKKDTIWTALIRWDSTKQKINKSEALATIRRFLMKRLKADTVLIQEYKK